jgi:hypothetical protein
MPSSSETIIVYLGFHEKHLFAAFAMQDYQIATQLPMSLLP